MYPLFSKSPPLVPGFDVAGTVIRVGAQATRFRLGDKVYGRATAKLLGTFAEYAALPESCLALKPRNLSFAEAATLPLAGLTSFQALFHDGGLTLPTKGDEKVEEKNVLIIGGSGGCGLFALQMAKHAKAAVIATTCSSRNFELVRSHGATVVVDYTTHDWAVELSSIAFDLVFDAMGGDNWQKAQRVLKPGGRFVTIGADSVDEKMDVAALLKTSAQVINRKFWSLFGYTHFYIVITRNNAEDFQALTGLAESGVVVPHIENFFRLEEVSSAFVHSLQGRTRGKVAVCVDNKANAK